VNKREAMHFANCAVLAAVLFFTTLIENLRLCSSAEAGIVLNLFLNFEQKSARVLMKKMYCIFLCDH